MKETTVEQYLIDQVEERGGKAPKHVSPGDDGEPDRLVFLPGGRLGLLELKQPGETPKAKQALKLRAYRRLGFLADWTDNRHGVDRFIERVEALPGLMDWKDLECLK